MRPDARVCTLDHGDAYAIALCDVRQRLPARDVMVHERDTLGDGETVVALRHERSAAARHAHDHAPAGGRDAPDVLRVELEERRNGRVGEAGDDIESGRVGTVISSNARGDSGST